MMPVCASQQYRHYTGHRHYRVLIPVLVLVNMTGSTRDTRFHRHHASKIGTIPIIGYALLIRHYTIP